MKERFSVSYFCFQILLSVFILTTIISKLCSQHDEHLLKISKCNEVYKFFIACVNEPESIRVIKSCLASSVVSVPNVDKLPCVLTRLSPFYLVISKAHLYNVRKSALLFSTFLSLLINLEF